MNLPRFELNNPFLQGKSWTAKIKACLEALTLRLRRRWAVWTEHRITLFFQLVLSNYLIHENIQPAPVARSKKEKNRVCTVSCYSSRFAIKNLLGNTFRFRLDTENVCSQTSLLDLRSCTARGLPNCCMCRLSQLISPLYYDTSVRDQLLLGTDLATMPTRYTYYSPQTATASDSISPNPLNAMRKLQQLLLQLRARSTTPTYKIYIIVNLIVQISGPTNKRRRQWRVSAAIDPLLG